MTFSKKQLQDLQKAGKLRGFKIDHRPTGMHHAKQKAVGNVSTRSKYKDYIETNVGYWCNKKALSLSREHQFDPERKWRFDWAIEAVKIAIEYEGLIAEKSGHTTVNGYTANTEKYNRAQALGWTVLRFTVLNYKSLTRSLNDVYDHVISR